MTVATENVSRKASFNREGILNYRKTMTSWLKFKLGMAYMLPLGLLTGMRITKLEEDSCEVTVPYKFLNKNPFKTTYWAVLGGAAEMAGGAILLSYARNVKPSVATFVVGCESKFVNRALGVTTFVCNDGAIVKENVIKAIETNEAVTFDTRTIGYDNDGKVIADFLFTWSVKARSK